MAFIISWVNKLILHRLKTNATAIALAHEIFINLFVWFQIFYIEFTRKNALGNSAIKLKRSKDQNNVSYTL